MTLILALILALATPSPALDVSPRREQGGAPHVGHEVVEGPGSLRLRGHVDAAETVERRDVVATAGGAPLTGWATHYPAASPTDGAAGPDLRAMLGKGWRGQWVRVCHGSECVRVQLRDWCACGDRHGKPTLVDLPKQTFSRLAPLGLGVIPVSIREADVPSLPDTSTVEARRWQHR
jgi:hypothetical protein